MTDRLRTRALLASNRTLVVALCVALALAGGWLTYGAYADPGTHAEERTVASWESTAEFDHGATVTKENSLYETGRSLRNRPAYFTNVSPALDGSFVYGYDASDGGSLDVLANATLVVQHVEEDRDGNVTVLWETTESLGSVESADVGPGEPVAVPFSFDAAGLADRVDEIDEDLDNPPGRTRAFVAVDVGLSGTVNGQRVDRTEEYELPFEPGATLRVDDPGAMTESHETTEAVLVSNAPGPVGRFGGPLLLLAGLAGLGGLVVADRRGALVVDAGDRARLAHAADRDDFEEWIHAVSLPPEAEERPVAHADSLADLVDFAIDADTGVVEDPGTGVYSVLHGDLRYVYVPPDADDAVEPRRSWELPREGVQIDLDAVPTDGSDAVDDGVRGDD